MTQQLLTSALPAVTRADVEAVARDEPAWLRERRLDAWQLYESMDLPDPGDEEWRRTDMASLDLSGLRPRSESAHGLGRNGHGNLEQDLRANGVVFAQLAVAAREHESLVRDRLYSVVRPDEWKYLALNAALWSDGYLLYVPKGVALTLPVQAIQSARGDDAVFSRTLVIAERDSSVVFVDEAESVGRSFVSGAVEIFVGDGAKVEYYNINRWGDGVYNFNTVRAVLGRDAQFTALAAGIGSKLTKMRIDTEMPEPGAQAQLLGVTFGSGDQHFDYNTLQNHHGHHTISDLQFKSALTDSSSLVWYGITRINPGASAAEANQTSRNLLLSEHAKAAPIPILEIQAYDVAKCSHGATAGPVEETELFYLQSRGIPKDVAEHLLVEGFFADVIDRIPSADVRERVMDAVLAKAGGREGGLTWDEVLSA